GFDTPMSAASRRARAHSHSMQDGFTETSHDSAQAASASGGRREADQLMVAFAERVGIPWLELDPEGRVCLSFDGHMLNLAYDERRGDFPVYARVGDVPANADRAFYERLFQLSYAAALSGEGTLAVDGDHGAVVWLDRVVPRGMTAAMLQEALD